MKTEKISFAVDVETGYTIETTIPDMIKSRILWEGDSGSGKSHGMTGMIEKTDGKAQRIIIDPEGEYFPLKNNFQFLLVGKKTEIVTPNLELNLDDIYVDKLIKKLIEKSVDIIIDLSEFPSEATHFFKIFKIAVFKYAKLMKRPLLIFVDEAQLFAPEKGQGNEESLKAMMELAKQGRKRGIGLICGTQAIADFSKNVVRQLRTRFIGNCTYDNDIKAAAHTLGFGKDRESELKKLGEDHHFFVSTNGGHITVNGEKPKQVLKIKCNDNKTKLHDFDFNSTKKFKEKDAQALQNLVSDFSDIPQEIDDELTEKERLQQDNNEKLKTIQEQKIKISNLERLQPKQDHTQLHNQYAKGFNDGNLKVKQHYLSYETQTKNTFTQLQSKYDSLVLMIDTIHTKSHTLDKIERPKLPNDIQLPKETKLPIHTNTKTKPIPAYIISENNSNIKLGRCEESCLKALAQRGKLSSKIQIAIIAGYSPTSGSFSNAISKLKTTGMINGNGSGLEITQSGINYLGTFERIADDPETILNFWINKVGKCTGAILKFACENHPSWVTKISVAESTRYSVTSGSFSNGISKLNSLGLIERGQEGMIKSSEEMFGY